jgi:hypothetical protein
LQPLISDSYLRGISGGRKNLRKQSVRIKCDGREKLFEIAGAEGLRRRGGWLREALIGIGRRRCVGLLIGGLLIVWLLRRVLGLLILGLLVLRLRVRLLGRVLRLLNLRLRVLWGGLSVLLRIRVRVGTVWR